MAEKRLNARDYLDPIRQLSFHRRTVSKPVALHFHEFYELEIVLHGSGTQNLNGVFFEISEGSVYLLTPVDFHAITPTDSFEVLNIGFDGSLISPELAIKLMQKEGNLSFCDLSCARALITLANRIEKPKFDAYSAAEIRSVLELMIIDVLRQKDNAHNNAFPSPMQDAMLYLYRNFSQPVSLSDMAALTGYTPSYFSKLFLQKCGMGFHTFLEHLRVNYAKQLLISTHDSISQISEKSGFASLSSFYRIFHNATGESPSNYRTKYAIL